jgi:hypothetical protein
MITVATQFAHDLLDALRRLDIPALPAFAKFPLFLTTPKGSVFIQDASDMVETMQKIQQLYQPGGLVSFDAEILELSRLTASSVLLRTQMRTRSGNGTLLAEGPYAFILRRAENSYRISSIISEGPAALLLAEKYPQDNWMTTS